MERVFVETSSYDHAFELLESDDSSVYENIRHALREDLQNTSNHTLLNRLVDYYLMSKSRRACEILVSAPENQAKFLFQKLADELKQAKQIEVLTIMTHFAHRRPSWLWSVSQSPLLAVIMKMLEETEDGVVLVCGLLFLSSLLPLVVPFLSEPRILEPFCLVFHHSVDWLYNYKHKGIEFDRNDVLLLHAQIAISVYFQRLYGMFPCNTITSLRTVYAGKDGYLPDAKTEAFGEIIAPLLHFCKLHPMLLTSTKAYEITKNRWIGMEPHDIVAECCQCSFDVFEGGGYLALPLFSEQGYIRAGKAATFTSMKNAYRTLQNVQSNVQITEHDVNLIRPVAITLPNGGIDAAQIQSGTVWSPTEALGLSTPPDLSRSVTPASVQNRCTSALDGSISLFNTPEKYDGRRSSDASSLRHRSSFGEKMSQWFKPKLHEQCAVISPTKRKSSIDADTMQFAFQPPPPNSAPAVISLGKGAPVQNLTAILQQRTLSIQPEVAEEAQEDTEDPAVSLLPSQPDESLSDESSVKRINLKTLPDVLQNVSALNNSTAESDKAVDAEVRLYTNQNSFETSTSEDRSAIEREKAKRQSSLLEATMVTPPVAPSDLESPAVFRSAASGTGVTWSMDIDDGRESVPRLAKSESVAEFMKRVNRIRFHSHCVTDQLDGDESIGETSIRPLRRRSFSCPDGSHNDGEQLNSFSIERIAKGTQTLGSSALESTKSSSDEGLDVRPKVVDAVGEILQHMSRVAHDSELAENFPYLHLLNEILKERPTDEAEKSKVLKSPFELLDDYMKSSHCFMQLHGLLDSGDESTVNWTHFGGKPPSDEIALLKARLTLLHHQLLYERYKRIIHAERNRRLFGRTKQISSLENQLSAFKDQMAERDAEIAHLISALSDIRRVNVSLKDDFATKEYQMTTQIHKLMKERDDLKASYEIFKQQFEKANQAKHDLAKQVGDFKQRLFDAEHSLVAEKEKSSRVGEFEKEVEELKRRLAITDEMRIKFRNLMKATMNCGVFRKDSMIENEQIQKMAEASRRETNDVRKNLRKERSRAEAAQQRIAELDQVLQKRQQQIGELRRQVEMMRFTHKEHVQALQAKYRSLMGVCARQEQHIAELYKQIELVAVSKQSNAAPYIPPRSGPREIRPSSAAEVIVQSGGSSNASDVFLPILFEEQLQQHHHHHAHQQQQRRPSAESFDSANLNE